MKELRYESGLSSRERGRIHGESFAADIRDLAKIRTELIMAAWDQRTPDLVRSQAEAHLPILERYHGELFEEFVGIAEGSGLSLTDLLILNHYTDLRDLKLEEGDRLEEGCSILHVRHGSEVLVGQTWDMHATATPFVMMMLLPDEGCWVMTITGCLGLCGLTRDGLAVGINNLVMSDARVGVSWPTLVRAMLLAGTTQGAEKVLRETPVGSGHHYILADRTETVAWEKSGTKEVQVYGGPGPYVHTNHCLAPDLAALSQIAATSTTQHRFQQATRLLSAQPEPGPLEMWEMMGCRDDFPNSIFTDRSSSENPHGVATCARVLLDCGRAEVWARSAADPDQSPNIYRFEEP